MYNNSRFVVKSVSYVYFICVNCVLGSFLFGYEMMSIGALSDVIVKYNRLNSQNEAYFIGIITSSLPLGAFIAMFFTGRLTQVLGTRKALILLDISAIMFLCFETLEPNIFVLTFARFFLGIIIGLNSAIIPKYIISLSPVSMSGATGSLNQLFITLGIAVAYIVGFAIKSDELNPNNSPWKLVVLLPASTCLVRAILLIFYIPFDTLDRHYQLEEMEMIQHYCEIMYENVDSESLIKALKLNKIKKKDNLKVNEAYTFKNSSYKKRYILAVVVALSGQLSGINSILFYAKVIFMSITNNDQYKSQMYCFGLGLAQTLVTLVSGFLLDKCGKKTFMKIGLSMILTTLFLIFVFTGFVKNSESITIFLIFLHVVGFSLSLGPIIWIYISQIIRQQSTIIALIWFVTFIVALSTKLLIDTVHIQFLALFYFVLELMAFLYILRNMKQTRGMNEKQIEELFDSKNKLESEEMEQLELNG